MAPVLRNYDLVALKSLRHSGSSFADLVPYAGLVDNGVILLKDGSLMAGWYLAGPDSESSTDAERNEVSRQINAILSRLGSGWMPSVSLRKIIRQTRPVIFLIRSSAPSTPSGVDIYRRRGALRKPLRLDPDLAPTGAAAIRFDALCLSRHWQPVRHLCGQGAG